MTNLDIVVLAAGVAITGGMFAFSLRRPTWPVTMDTEALHVGPRSVPWPTIERLAFGRGDTWSWFRLSTPDGELEFRGDQLDLPAETAAQRMASRAGLSPAQTLHVPRHGISADHWRAWARAPRMLSELGGVGAVPARSGESGEVDPPRPTVRRRSRLKLGGATPSKGKLARLGVLFLILLNFAKMAGVALGGGVKVLKLGKILPTAITMLGTVWAYATLWGWWFAAGFVGLILLHELGHAAVMRAKGLRTSPIVFVPFVGAFIAMKDQVRDATVEAETAYGGPAVGGLAALACLLVHEFTGNAFWLNLAYLGCLLNLFNLLPVAPLDGGRIATGISVWLWVLGLPAGLLFAVGSGHPILFLIVLLGGMRAWEEWKLRRDPAHAARLALPLGYRVRMATAYFGLIALLSYFTVRTMQLGGRPM